MIRVPCTPEQEDVIADHLIHGRELGILPDERAWIRQQVNKQEPSARIVGAELDLENAVWVVKTVTE